MATIKSLKKLKYDARDTSKEAVIKVKVEGFKYLMNQKYAVIIKDFAITEKEITTQPNIPVLLQPGETFDEEPITEIIEVETSIGLREKVYDKEKIDQLFNATSDGISKEESFTDNFEDLIAKSLLYITMDDPIYGSESSDWEIINE